MDVTSRGVARGADEPDLLALRDLFANLGKHAGHMGVNKSFFSEREQVAQSDRSGEGRLLV